MQNVESHNNNNGVAVKTFANIDLRGQKSKPLFKVR